ncbi:MAG: hypothetical protein ACREJ3_02935 [Polyangiaceae bacterium]
MYLAAQRVISPVSQMQAVNLFAYLHGPLAPGEFPSPDNNPGVAVWSDVRLAPPGNRVLGYLDIVCSDTLPLDQVRAYLAAIKHMLQPNGNPTIDGVGPLWVRFGLGHLSIPWNTELGALAGHLVTRLPPRLG